MQCCGIARPVILVEVEDKRTQPWGYRAPEIVMFLEERGYRWFRLSEGGKLLDIGPSRKSFDENLAAVPQEIAESVLASLRVKQ